MRPQLSSPGFIIHWQWTWAGQGTCSGQPQTCERGEQIHNPFPKEADSSLAGVSLTNMKGASILPAFVPMGLNLHLHDDQDGRETCTEMCGP